jgi:hypothetical protein
VKHYAFSFFISILLVSPLMLTSACAEKKPDLLFLLSHRHSVPDVSSLVSHFGTEEDLVNELLKIRLSEYPPHAALRAEAILLEQFSDRDEVIDALSEDLTHESRKGLARLIIRNLHKIKGDETKSLFSNKAAELVKNDKMLKNLKYVFEETKDPIVKKAFFEE